MISVLDEIIKIEWKMEILVSKLIKSVSYRGMFLCSVLSFPFEWNILMKRICVPSNSLLFTRKEIKRTLLMFHPILINFKFYKVLEEKSSRINVNSTDSSLTKEIDKIFLFICW